MSDAQTLRRKKEETTMIPINVVNLDKDTKRWNLIVDDLTQNGVRRHSMERLAAVNGKQLSDEQLHLSTTKLCRIFCTRGMIGCYLSHVKFWQKIQSEFFPYQIVLEDDAQVCTSFSNVVQALVDELEATPERDKWDVLLLGAFCCVHPKGRFGIQRFQAWLLGGMRKMRRIAPSIHVPRRPLGTYGYVLSKRGAQKLLERVPRAAYHVDVVAWGLKDLNIYLADPMCVYQRKNVGSTIGGVSDIEKKYIPNWTLDDYTQVGLEWVLNEPILQIPLPSGDPFVLSIGRGLTILFGGCGLCLLNESPTKALVTHVAFCGILVVVFFRTMRHTGTRSVGLSKHKVA